MADILEYTKPNMTNIPKELGVAIFKQIMGSTVPDREKMRSESQRLVKENVEVRKTEIAKRNSARD